MSEKTDDDPLRLLAPEFRRHRVFAHVSGAVNGNDAEDGEGQHHDQEQPVEPEKLSKKRRHVDLIRPRFATIFEYSQAPGFATRFTPEIWKICLPPSLLGAIGRREVIVT